MNTPIVDSDLSVSDIVKQNPTLHCPEEVISQIAVVSVSYYSFDGKVHTGQVAVHKDLADDVAGAFEVMLQERFPVQCAIPISNPQYDWSDDASTAANNSSAFNYRYVRNTTEISNHALGRAIDINPRLNPYFSGGKVYPPLSTYNPNIPGTILASSKLVAYFKERGWRWGGEWNEDLDYQHFEKLEV